MKTKIIALSYSFSLMLVWGAGIINADGNQVTTVLSLVFTFTATFFMQRRYSFDKYEKCLLLLFPTLYYFVNAYLWEPFNTSFLLYPLNLSLLFLILSLIYIKDLTRPANLFFFGFVTVLYISLFYPNWRPTINESFFNKEKFNENNIDIVSTEDFTSLDAFQFVNSQNDTTLIRTFGKYILLETWSEACPPCLKAFKDLQPFYDEQVDRLSVSYIYENKKAEARQKTEKIFSYKYIRDKSKILIDLDQNLYKKAEMTGYPYFLLFNPNGKLVYSQSAYSSEIRTTLEQNILRAMGN